MAGFTPEFSAITLDAAIVGGDRVRYSENGAAPSKHLPATVISAWVPATASEPSLRMNRDAVESDGCDADSITITKFSVWDAAEKVQKSPWTPLGKGPRRLMQGDKITWAARSIVVSMGGGK